MVERDQHFESIKACLSKEQWDGPLHRGRCYPRCTGRTMYTKLMAVAAAGNGQTVVIFGHTRSYTKRVVDHARQMAQLCGINPMLISMPEKLHPTEADDVGRDPSAEPRELYDHHYFEHELEKQRARWELERSRNRW
jgi:hypothetical protein